MRAFLDTNVLVYAACPDDARKQGVAQALLAGPGARDLTISTQVLAECFSVLTRTKAWRGDQALLAMRVFAKMRVVALNADGLLAGLELAVQHQLSPWDGMILQAAVQGGCDTVFSEDLQAGQRFGALEVVNPFELQAHEAAPAWPVQTVRKVQRVQPAPTTQRAQRMPAVNPAAAPSAPKKRAAGRHR